VQPNGDIVCGSSDGEVRIFTRERERWADEKDIKEFEEKVAGSAIPQEVLGDINKEKLPGLSALKQKGIPLLPFLVAASPLLLCDLTFLTFCAYI